MKRIRQGWNTLRRSRRSGVSLIVALCAVAVLIGLSLSIVYSSSMLLSRANRKIGRERCYQLGAVLCTGAGQRTAGIQNNKTGIRYQFCAGRLFLP